MRQARFLAGNVKRRSKDDKHGGGSVITWQKKGEAVSLLERAGRERLVQQQEPHEQREESREERLHRK